MSPVTLYGEIRKLLYVAGNLSGFSEFPRLDAVIALRWSAGVLRRRLYDHADNETFLQDYGNLELAQIGGQVEALSVDVVMSISTGSSDAGVTEEFAREPEHRVAFSNYGEHPGVWLA